MKIENTETFGFNASLKAMRNPKNSWHMSDSLYSTTCKVFILGEKDARLSVHLTKAGNEHCKHLRMIQVWADMTLPRYIWQEFDTYKHLEKNSCSTMHTIMKRDLLTTDFENGNVDLYTLDSLNHIRSKYINSKTDEEKTAYLVALKRILPEGFLQKRTINTNYQQLLNIYRQRKNHQLPEWQEICNWIKVLPHFIELTGVIE
jgi:hypothetical protein